MTEVDVRENEAGRKREREKERMRFEDAMLLALKIEEGVSSQGIQTASTNWKKQENGFSP